MWSQPCSLIIFLLVVYFKPGGDWTSAASRVSTSCAFCWRRDLESTTRRLMACEAEGEEKVQASSLVAEGLDDRCVARRGSGVERGA